MQLGKNNRLIVKREADISYLLTDGEVEIFLHKKEAERPYVVGEEIDVFLYDDNQGRVTASTKPPSLIIGGIALLEVVSVNFNYGAFLYYGMIKDLLLSLDDLPKNKRLWPQANDKMFMSMQEKNNRLFAKVLTRHELTESFEDLEVLEKDEKYDAYVMYLIENGYLAYSEAGHEIFIHKNNIREEARIGKKVSVKIIAQNEKGNYSGTLIEQKEIMLDKDANIVFEYLENHGGIMPYTDKSDAADISKVFHMSKSAFKRALGHLYHLKKVELNKDNTKLVGE
jgi:predicted RNA-binding protein (virulence factor B family)